MSHVTNLIITHGLGEQGEYTDNKLHFLIQDKIDAWFKENNYGHGPVSCDRPEQWYGGTRHLECEILIGAYNYLDLFAVMDFLRSLPWKSPECVQLMYMQQEDDRFTVVNYRDLPDLPQKGV